MRTTLPGHPPIEMQVRHTPRARRISLRVSGRDGRVTLTVPQGADTSEAIGFAREREAWLRQALADIPPRERPEIGGRVPVEGAPTEIVVSPVRRPVLRGGQMHVPMHQPLGPELARFFKTLARERAERAITRHSAAIGRACPTLSLRDTRSRWGSCTAEGRLMLSWRLAMAPPDILDYVAAHEVAHLVHMDHSSRFWSVTARLFPAWKTARRWLRDEGGRLQAVDFT